MGRLFKASTTKDTAETEPSVLRAIDGRETSGNGKFLAAGRGASRPVQRAARPRQEADRIPRRAVWRALDAVPGGPPYRVPGLTPIPPIRKGASEIKS